MKGPPMTHATPTALDDDTAADIHDTVKGTLAEHGADVTWLSLLYPAHEEGPWTLLWDAGHAAPADWTEVAYATIGEAFPEVTVECVESMVLLHAPYVYCCPGCDI